MELDKKEYSELLMNFIKNELTDHEKSALLAAVNKDKKLTEELMEIQNTWALLNKCETPVPTQRMDEQFQSMFLSYKNKPGKLSAARISIQISGFFSHVWPTHIAARTAMASLLVLIIFFGGYWFSFKQSHTAQIKRQYVQIKDLQSNMMLTLLAQKSPIERLKAVSISQDLTEINANVIEALLNTLNKDDNDNIRLASLEALVNYADNPQVRLGLIAAIGYQESPLVQMALAEAMVELQEKRSIDALQDLLKSENTIEEIKGKIQESINVLI